MSGLRLPTVAAVLTAMVAGPGGWIVQLTVTYGLSSYACFPRSAALASPSPAWQGERTLLLAVNLVCLLVVLIGLVVSFRAWRTTRTGTSGAALRFLGFAGVLSGTGFTIAVLFGAWVAAFTPTCWSFR